MKDPRKRMALTLSPEVHAALDRFSAVTGVAASSYIASMVEDALPVIEATTRALEAAKRNPQQAADILNETLVATVAKAAQGQLELDEAIKDRKRRRRSPKPR